MTQLKKGTATDKTVVRIHNDLGNAAYYFKEIIEKKMKDGGGGIALDSMACATMLAFTWEAYLNFFVSELLAEGWDEKTDLETKENLVLEKLGIKPDWGKQPYNSIRILTKIRNWLAHGKPVEREFTKKVVLGVEKVVSRKVDVSGDWQKLCTPTIVLRAHGDLDTIFKEMLTASGIAFIDTLSSGESNITFTEVVTVGK